MKIPPIFGLLMFLVPAIVACASVVDAPRGVNHDDYDRLLKIYVDDRGLVNYKAWKQSAEDLQALKSYTAQFADPEALAEGDGKIASLINAYNALTIQWILDNYPVRSIKSTTNPWGAKRWRVGGRDVSLDEIEHDTLRPLVGYRIHAVLVCAANSCPPLRAGAYRAENLDEQLDEAMRSWLAREDLNQFLPERKRVELSKIFSWYGGDFEKVDGGLKAVLGKYGPAKFQGFLRSDYRVGYLPYEWELNEQL